MNRTLKISSGLLALTMMIAVMFGAPKSALAHGEIQVEGYDIEVGFHVEPAYQGLPNGLDLFVHNHETGKPVNGLEKTLKVEIIYGAQKKELELYPQDEQDGAYTADLIPTKTGDYTWHVWGDIEGHAVDFDMTSGPDTFGAVESPSDKAFPEAASSVADAVQMAQTATLVGAGGLVLGLVGIVLGVLAMRKRKE